MKLEDRLIAKGILAVDPVRIWNTYLCCICGIWLELSTSVLDVWFPSSENNSIFNVQRADPALPHTDFPKTGIKHTWSLLAYLISLIL